MYRSHPKTSFLLRQAAKHAGFVALYRHIAIGYACFARLACGSFSTASLTKLGFRITSRIALILLIAFSIAEGAKDYKRPLNIILLISDGCGYNQIDAASIYQYGKTGMQAYERFPVIYAMSTHSADGEKYDPGKAWKSFDYVKKKPTDSAAAATAMATGHKTYNGSISMDMNKKPLPTIVERCEQAGKATGVVTSVQFSHASPACMAAHNKSRRNYVEIARELIMVSRLDVLMGAGHPLYDDDGKRRNDANYKYNFVGGEDTWQAVVAGNAGGDADGDGTNDPWILVEERSAFQALASGTTPKRILGIAKVHTTLHYSRSGTKKGVPYAVPFNESIPTLEEMTRAALNALDDNKKGFFLMIEGGAVDWGSHGNNSGRMIEEEIDFNKAVTAVIEWVEAKSSWEQTLVIVTGDHETGYLTGPGSDKDKKALWKKLVNNGKGTQPGMEWHSKKHTNSLIPFFAKGAGSNVFHKYAVKTDSVRGKYLDNADIGIVLFTLVETPKK